MISYIVYRYSLFLITHCVRYLLSGVTPALSVFAVDNNMVFSLECVVPYLVYPLAFIISGIYFYGTIVDTVMTIYRFLSATRRFFVVLWRCIISVWLSLARVCRILVFVCRLFTSAYRSLASLRRVLTASCRAFDIFLSSVCRVFVASYRMSSRVFSALGKLCAYVCVVCLFLFFGLACVFGLVLFTSVCVLYSAGQLVFAAATAIVSLDDTLGLSRSILASFSSNDDIFVRLYTPPETLPIFPIPSVDDLFLGETGPIFNVNDFELPPWTASDYAASESSSDSDILTLDTSDDEDDILVPVSSFAKAEQDDEEVTIHRILFDHPLDVDESPSSVHITPPRRRSPRIAPQPSMAQPMVAAPQPRRSARLLAKRGVTRPTGPLPRRAPAGSARSL